MAALQQNGISIVIEGIGIVIASWMAQEQHVDLMGQRLGQMNFVNSNYGQIKLASFD